MASLWRSSATCAAAMCLLVGCGLVTDFDGLELREPGAGGTSSSSGGAMSGGNGASGGAGGGGAGTECDAPPCPLGASCRSDADCEIPGTCSRLIARCQRPIGTWTQLGEAPTKSSSYRFFSAMGYSPEDGAFIRNGGVRATGELTDPETYRLDGDAWTVIQGRTLITGFEVAMARDYDSNETILYDTQTPTPHTYARNPPGWNVIAEGTAEHPPDFRSAYGLSAVPGSSPILFGGFSQHPPEPLFGHNDTWQLEAGGWTAIELDDPTRSPDGRGGIAMAPDASGRVLMVGGWYVTIEVPTDQWWLWDGSTWTEPSLEGCGPGPEDRAFAALAFDETRRTTLLFGGANATELFGDTWEWDGSCFSPAELAPGSDAPAARSRHRLAWDPTGRVILFGGAAGPGLAAFGDTWSYVVRGNACDTGDDCNSKTCIGGVCCEAACTAGQVCNRIEQPGVCMSASR